MPTPTDAEAFLLVSLVKLAVDDWDRRGRSPGEAARLARLLGGRLRPAPAPDPALHGLADSLRTAGSCLTDAADHAGFMAARGAGPGP